MNSEIKNNPFLNITIGSIVIADQQKFQTSVVTKPITKMIPQEITHKFMSGESNYVHSSKMNQGSFGISGAYGISGVSMINSALSAYVGASSAQSSKSMSVYFNAGKIAGVEYINFEDLSVSEFIASLNKACKENITSALKAYNDVIDNSQKNSIDISRVYTDEDPKTKELRKLVTKWVNESEKFINNFGNGLVVGIAWGAYGGVKMSIKSKSSSNIWKYGTQADFSYANIGASFAVKQIYDGGQSNDDADIEISCDSYHCGSAIANEIDHWAKEFQTMQVKELLEVKVLDKAPDLNISHVIPSIPPFEQPKEKEVEAIAKEVEKIDNLEKLDDMAKCDGFSKAIKDKPDTSFNEFNNVVDKKEKASTKKLDTLKEKILNNKIDTSDLFKNPDKKDDKKFNNTTNSNSTLHDFGEYHQSAELESNPDNNQFVPLGIWVCNWADLFPWLAQGYYNSIDGIMGEEKLKARVMLQDLQTLTKLYYIADSVGIKTLNSNEKLITTLDIAADFSNCAERIIAKMVRNTDKLNFREIYEKLGSEARFIYDLWNKIGFLRNCELGLGFIKDNKTTINAPTLTKTGTIQKDELRKIYSLSDSSFNGKNHSVFCNAYKVLPLLTPDGKIWAIGPQHGGLSSVYDTEIVFSKPGRAKYINFDYDKSKEVLSNSQLKIELYPIRFSAALGCKWKGMSFSTNVGSDDNLDHSLNSISDRLKELNTWTFSSDSWDKDWSGEKPYVLRNIKKQYLGIIDEVPNIFA